VIIGIGTDIIAVARIKKNVEANPRFTEKLFTPAEIAYCSAKAWPEQSYAARFAGKEAVMKAFGTGWDGVVNWTDIEILPNTQGSPFVTLTGGAKSLADTLKVHAAHISLSHEKEYAIATAILEGL
jgi:holo-[acyl-carrier protein] synthase